MTFEMTRIMQRLADLEKGYKDLSKVYGQQKLISFETITKSLAAFEHTKSGMKAFQESIESIEDVMRQTAKTIDSLTTLNVDLLRVLYSFSPLVSQLK